MGVIKDKALFDIDHKIDTLVQQIELLNYINPNNIEKEKKRFFNSKFTIEPKFKYPRLSFDAFELQRALFAIKIKDIEDVVVRKLYEDIIYEYSDLVECIDTIGQGKRFYYNSLRSFGTPTETEVENAKFILHFNDQSEDKDVKTFNASETEQQFRDYSKRYDFSYNISKSNKLSAIAMVLNHSKTLVLNTNHAFTQNDIDILTNHEIGVHMVTTMNGVRNPLKIFSHGFPNNTETQEGLAVYAEFMSNNLNLNRLKRIAYRVLAVDSLAKGYNFPQTFALLRSYGMNENNAFTVCVRVHRGGGFTKDYLYLSGLKKVYKYAKEGGELNTLLTGKVTLEYKASIDYLIKKGCAKESKYITDSFSVNSNTDATITFILENLK